jgi:hypothetical protein
VKDEKKKEAGRRQTARNRKEKFVLQWYWHKDWNNKWSKALYNGPRIEWMNLHE